jgi:TonB-linked SusC/RagA family outer membrane protein
MKRLLLVLGFTACIVSLAFAQDTRTVSGTILDTDGLPLIGATVTVPSTSIGTATDIDGNFSLAIPFSATQLQIDYTGYLRKTIDVTTEPNSSISIVLAEDVIGLEEAVVIGYAPVRRKDLVGSVSSIDGELAAREAGATVQSALRQAAGVSVQQTNGAPGAAFNIRVRGATSITASNEPLYVVDGVPVVNQSFAQTGIGGQESNSLADLNPNDIESIEVLKDASTTAIYGSRAANGVVLITTKRGAAGATKINFNSSYGFNEATNTIDIVDGPGYVDFIEERFGTRNVGALDPALDSTVSNNWQDLIFETNPIQNYNLSFSGGDVKTKFFSSLNYDDNQGYLRGTRFRRYNARLNLDHTLSSKLTTSLQLGYNNSQNDLRQNDNNIFGAVSSSILLPPVVSIRNDDGSFGSAFGLENPVAAVDIYSNELKTNRFIGNSSLSYLPTQWLTLTTRLQVDALDLRETVFEPSLLQSSPNGIINEGATRNMRVVNEYLASFNHSVGKAQIAGTVGAIFQNNTFTRTYFTKTDLPNNTPSADAAASPTDVFGDESSDRLTSYIASLNFNLGNNFFATASFRADGSSRFVNDRFGYFPGVAVGYDFSKFVPGFDQFKLRSSIGQTGNNNIGDFQSRALFSGARRFLNTPGTSPLQIGNADLRWETTTTFDVGLDFALLEDKISGSIGVYNKRTEDLLLGRPLPTTSGFTTVLENIGAMRNRGFEASLNFVGAQTKDWQWVTTVIAAYNDNEVLELFDNQPFDSGFATRTAEGEPLGSFFGFVTDGIFQNEQEVEDGPVPAGLAVAPGDFRFRDLNDDGIINDQDRTFIGQALPDWTGGIDNRVSYRGLELQAFVQFNLGNDVYNNNLAFAEGLNSVFAPTARSFAGAWREEGDGDDFPRIGGGVASTNNRRDSDRFVEDGSFVRIKSARLSYDVPSEPLNSVGIRSVRVYVSATNLVTFTDYSWFDPEVNTFGTDSNTALGTDFLTLPQARTVQFGLNLGF